jgi:hypothetical protein
LDRVLPEDHGKEIHNRIGLFRESESLLSYESFFLFLYLLICLSFAAISPT